MKKVEIYSDGGARPNPGPGGYGVILRFNGKEKEFSGFENNTTNNRMELTGVIVGLSKLKEKCDVQVFTDSSYVVNGIEKGWAQKWKENNWMRTKSEKAINYDLWEKLLEEVSKHKVKFNWVRGHNGHEENERCDELATGEILKNSFLPSSQPSPLEEKEQEHSVRKLELKSPGYIFELAKKFRKNLTKSEEKLWNIIRDKKLNNLKFRRQHPIGRYIADFYCEELKVVLELDGEIHKEINRKEYDIERDNLLKNYGFNIIRFKNKDILSNSEKEIINILENKLPLLQRRGLGGGLKSSSKTKITKAGDKCRKCGTPVVKAIPKKKNTKNKSYYYEYYLSCPNCATNYFVDEAKVMINKLDF